MTASISNLACDFCGLSQAATQPHCMGCGAALPLKPVELETNKKLLDLTTRMNKMLATENARIKGESRLRRFRVAIGLTAASCILWSVVWGFSRSHSMTYNEEAMMFRNNTAQSAAQMRYSQALERELFNSQGQLPEPSLE